MWKNVRDLRVQGRQQFPEIGRCALHFAAVSGKILAVHQQYFGVGQLFLNFGYVFFGKWVRLVRE
jgi:hypothetical protein